VTLSDAHQSVAHAIINGDEFAIPAWPTLII
jgi:hypothetical protein